MALIRSNKESFPAAESFIFCNKTSNNTTFTTDHKTTITVNQGAGTQTYVVFNKGSYNTLRISGASVPLYCLKNDLTEVGLTNQSGDIDISDYEIVTTFLTTATGTTTFTLM